MILIGMYDSPFVRRVGVAMRLYGMDFEHRDWSVFGDADKIAQYNPLIRVPTLVLDDGEVLIESAAILDALDEIVGPHRALYPHTGPQRRRAMKVAALAAGIADKAVSLVYERVVHMRSTDVWVQRCTDQIRNSLSLLEDDRSGHSTDWWMGEHIGHADIAVACTLRFLRDAHSDLVQLGGFPALNRHSETCETMPVFREIGRAFLAPGARD